MKKTRLFLRRFLALTICLVMFFTMGVSLNADKLSAYAMAENSSSKSDENVEVYFEKSDGKIVKPDSNGKFTLTSIETGTFKLNGFSGTPYFKCATEEKEGINRWTDVWVNYRGKYQGHGIKEVTAKVYSKDPMYPDAKLLKEFKIDNKSSELEKLIPYIDGKSVADDETIPVNGSEYKKITLKGIVKGSDKEIDIPAHAVTIKYTKGSYVQNNGEEIYANINTAKASEATINIKMTDGSAGTKFHLSAKDIALKNFDIEYPHVAYIRDWNGLNGKQYVGITASDTATDRNYKLTFEPAAATNKTLHWKALTPEIAEYQELYGNGIVPKKSGVAKFEVTSDENPNLKKTVSIEFKYKNPLKSASAAKTSYEIKANQYQDIEIKANPENATEQRFNWTFDKEGIVRIDEMVTRTSTSEPHKTTHRLVGLSKGKVKAVGTPVDSTGGAKSISLEIVVNESEQGAGTDYVKLAQDLLEYGKTALLDKSHSKYGDEWTLFTLARSGADISKSDKDAYLASVRKVLEEDEKNPSLMTTDYARLAITLGSMGFDASTKANYKLISKLYNDKRIEKATANAAIFALIAIDTKSYDVPGDALWTREKLIEQILSYQSESGGFSLYKGGSGGVDITAMALQSLSPYYDTNAKVKNAVDKALKYLENTMDATGSYGGNSCSDAQVLTSLSSLGIDAAKSEKFQKLKSNLVGNMEKYKAEGGFGIGIGGEANDFANTQVTYSLNAYLRLVEKKPSLYKFSDVDFNKEEEEKEFDAAKMYDLIDKIYSLVDLPLPENNNSVIKASEEFKEMLKVTPEDYIDALKSVEYILSALNGKIELMNIVNTVDFKDNTKKAKEILNEAINSMNAALENGDTVETIENTVEKYKAALEALKPQEQEEDEFDSSKMYDLIDKVVALADLPLPEKKDEVLKTINEYNEMLKVTPADYIDELKDVEYIIAALSGKLELMDIVDKFDYKANSEKAKAMLKEAINRLNALIDDKAAVEDINKTVDKYKAELENLKTQEEPVKDPVRLAGADRYETSLRVADELKKTMNVDKFDTAVVAYGDNYADALSGAYLAKVNNAPLLLINENNMQGAIDYIKTNLKHGKSSKVYLLGGTKVMPELMRTKLEDRFTVKRLSGDDRFATNIAILKEAGVNDEELIVSSGYDFADSLAASATGRPILLVGDTITKEQMAYLKTIETRKYTVTGGINSVNTSIEGTLKSLGTVDRVYGEDRYKTSISIAKHFFKNPKTAVVGYGDNFPDGLCGGVLAERRGAPLLLINEKNTDSAKQYVKDNSIKESIVLGGKILISDAVVDSITK